MSDWNETISWLPLTDSVAVLAVLIGVCALFFFLEQRFQWRLFRYLPPLIFIYLVPVVLSNAGVLPTSSPVYDVIGRLLLPMMLVLMLLNVDVFAAVRVMGRGIIVMLAGTLGIVLGAPLGLRAVQPWLGPEAWKAYGTLAGSWIGGTGNMAAMEQMLQTGGTEFGLAVLADTTIYILWLPILLGSKAFAKRFAQFTGVSSERVARMEAAVAEMQEVKHAASFRDYIYLLFVAVFVTFIADAVSRQMPELPPVVTAGTWRILIVTTTGIGLSLTPLRRVAGSHELALALVYIFVARMGASAELEGVAASAIPFLTGSLICIGFHGGCCLLAAKLCRVDVHTAAIASAANVGGAASAPIVAAHHNESLVPASILMAMLGYALGNYAAYGCALLCRLVSQQSM